MPKPAVLQEAQLHLSQVTEELQSALAHLETLEPYTAEFAGQAWRCSDLASSKRETQRLVDVLNVLTKESSSQLGDG